MRIDVHTHLISLDFLTHLLGRSSVPNALLEGGTYFVDCTSNYRLQCPPQHADMEEKLRDMERMGVDVSVLSHGIPGPELLGGTEADDWASRINDFMAGVVQAHPDKFIGWGSIGFGSPERSVAEVDRCINQLGFKGIQLFSNINQRVLDSPEFMPVYRHIADLGVPMNMHPTAPLNLVGIDKAPLIPSLGFIYDTSLGTMRLITSDLFDQAPNFKLIVPHVGGIIPYLGGRLERSVDTWVHSQEEPPLALPAADYMAKIYVDTVAHSPQALEYCYKLVGAERLLFGTDHPFANYIAVSDLVENLDCSEEDRELIYHGNPERLLGL